MVECDGVRDFELSVRGNGNLRFSDANVRGATPDEAALKAARWLKPASSEREAESDAAEIMLRETDTGRVYRFSAWAWEEDAPYDAPSWLGDTLYRADVEMNGS